MIEPNENKDSRQDFVLEAAADSFVDDAARASFSKTIIQMKRLVDSVRNLAQHAEDFFWQERADSFGSASLSVLSPDADWDTTGVNLSIVGAMKICMAAYPMLDEILEKFSLICSQEHKPLGTTFGASSWLKHNEGEPVEGTTGMLIAEDATGTFYIDTVIGICDEVDRMLEQLIEWNRNTDGFDSIAGIQKHYMSALIQMRNRFSGLLNHIGPFWPPTICPFSPYVRDTQSVYGAGNTVFPTHFSAVYDDTQTLRITLYHNAEVIPFHEAFRTAACNHVYNNVLVEGAYDQDDWAAAYTVMSNGDKVYRAEGGLVLIEASQDIDIDQGIYEVLEIGHDLLLRNKLLRAHSSTTKKSRDIDDITFRFRFLRKRREFYVGEGSPYDLVANVQYKADASLFQGDSFAVDQRMNFVFTRATNDHKAPIIAPVINDDDEEGEFTSYAWAGVTSTGTVPLVLPGDRVTNLSNDTLFNLVKSTSTSMQGRITDAVNLSTHILFCGEFTGLYGDQASLMTLNLATNRFEHVPVKGAEHISVKSISWYHSWYQGIWYRQRVFGSFFVGNVWTNIIRLDGSDYSVKHRYDYPFIDVQGKDIIASVGNNFTVPGVGHYINGKEILDPTAVSVYHDDMLNKHSLVNEGGTYPVTQEILGNSIDTIYAYDDSDDSCKRLSRSDGSVLGTLNKSGKPKVLRNHDLNRLLYGDEIWYVDGDDVSMMVASVDDADEINASVPATVGEVPSEVVFGKNITVNGETGIGYIFGLNRFIGTGLE